MGSATGWCFTLNNPRDDEAEGLVEAHGSGKAAYIVYAEEIGTSGTPHLQGYIHFVRDQRVSMCKKLLPRAHWEPRRGSPEQASNYCKGIDKDGNPKPGYITHHEYGQLPVNLGGKKKQDEMWSEIRVLADAHQFQTLKEKFPSYYYRYQSALHKSSMAVNLPSNYLTSLASPCGIWIHGNTGVGKTYHVEQFKPHYRKEVNKWWDRYAYEPIVIIHEVTPMNIEYIATKLLIWADQSPFIAEVKGGSMEIRPKVLVITSNFNLEQCMENLKPNSINLDALRRRFYVCEKRCINHVNL